MQSTELCAMQSNSESCKVRNYARCNLILNTSPELATFALHEWFLGAHDPQAFRQDSCSEIDRMRIGCNRSEDSIQVLILPARGEIRITGLIAAQPPMHAKMMLVDQMNSQACSVEQ